MPIALRARLDSLAGHRTGFPPEARSCRRVSGGTEDVLEHMSHSAFCNGAWLVLLGEDSQSPDGPHSGVVLLSLTSHVGLSATPGLTSSCPRAERPGTRRVTITNCLVPVRPARTASALPERHAETSQQAWTM